MKKFPKRIYALLTMLCLLVTYFAPGAVFAEGGEIEATPMGEMVYSPENISAETETPMPEKNTAQTLAVTQATEDVINFPLNSIVLRKTSAITGELLAGAVFELYQVTPEISGTGGTLIGRYTTDFSGTCVITGLEAGSAFIAKEVQPPQGYMLSENSQQQAWLKADGTSIVELTFSNYPYASILVVKEDIDSHAKLANAGFFVTDSSGAVIGSNGGHFTTDATGSFLISGIKPGTSIVCREETAPAGYALDATPQTLQVGSDGKTYTMKFYDKALGGLLIKKYSTSDRQPLSGAVFRITDINGAVIGEGDGMYTTDAQGTIYIPGLRGSLRVSETKAPNGFQLDANTQTIQISDNKIYTLEFYNQPLQSITIVKKDGDSHMPLANATIRITKADDTFVAERTTDSSGQFTVNNLSDGFYKVFETRAPSTHILDSTVKLIQLRGGHSEIVELFNYKQGGIRINKVNAQNNKGLSGAVYEVRKIDGTLIGSDFTTDSSGNVLVSNLSPGWYVCTELTPPTSFQNSPQYPSYGGYTSDDYYNGVSYYISGSRVYFTYRGITYYASGTTAYYIENSHTYKGYSDDDDVYTYTSNGIVRFRINGITYYSQGTQPYYIMNGTTYTGFPGGYYNGSSNPDYVSNNGSASGGYKLDGPASQNVQVARGGIATVTYRDFQYATLTIKKTDFTSGKGLANCEFTVTRDNGEHIGTYRSDSSGYVRIVDMTPGTYSILETQNPNAGYDAPSKQPKTVTLNWGDSKQVTIENYKLATVNFVKVSDDGKPMENVAFMLLDSNKNVIKTGVTDVQGNLQFTGLRAGTYYWKEVVPEGYTNSPLPTMFTLDWSDVRTINVTNNIAKGQIHVMKISDGNNNTTGHKDGDRLPGATFIVKNENNVAVDTLTTDQNGSAISKKLPYGHYTVWESQSPAAYQKNTEPAYVDITEDGKIYDIVIKNKPLEWGLTISKAGSYEVQAGDSFYYTINNVGNTSNAAVDHFNWVDTFPVHAVRMQKVETGVYNAHVNLKVSFKTNYSGEWRDWGSNIDTTQNSELNFGNILGSDEYVTELRFDFGTVPAGFHSVEETRIYCTALPGLENGQSFTNNIHLSGTTSDGTVIHGYDMWTTKVWKLVKWQPKGKLPQTGE